MNDTYDDTMPTVVTVNVTGVFVNLNDELRDRAQRAVDRGEYDDISTACCAIARRRIHHAIARSGIEYDSLDVVEIVNAPPNVCCHCGEHMNPMHELGECAHGICHAQCMLDAGCEIA